MDGHCDICSEHQYVISKISLAQAVKLTSGGLSLNRIKYCKLLTSGSVLQVVGVVDITTLNNRQYCVILDPVDKDGRPQLGQKRLVKVL